MKTTGRISAVVLMSFGAWTLHAQTSSIVKEASAIEWTVANLSKLHAIFPGVKEVADFENQTLAPDDRDDLDPQKVGEFLIVDLNNDGHLELICSVDVTDRAFYTDVVVFSQRRGQIVRTDTSTRGANMVDLGSRIVDLKHDGRKEILVPQLLGQYAGADPAAQLPAIYKFDHGQLVKASREFPDYYNRLLLPQLKAKLESLFNEPRSTTREKWIAVILQEIAIINYAFGE